MSFSVMAGLVPAIHVVVYGYGSRCSLAGGAAATLNLRAVDLGPTWMTGTSPVMTENDREISDWPFVSRQRSEQSTSMRS
jgi:hypothetical protein